jgi:hypothetical protein
MLMLRSVIMHAMPSQLAMPALCILLPQRARVNIVLEEYVDQSVDWSQVRS